MINVDLRVNSPLHTYSDNPRYEKPTPTVTEPSDTRFFWRAVCARFVTPFNNTVFPSNSVGYACSLGFIGNYDSPDGVSYLFPTIVSRIS